MTDSTHWASGVRPKGLLSFLYNAINDPETNQSCHVDIQGTMQFFGLTDDEQKAVLNAQGAGAPSQKTLGAILDLLLPELAEGYGVVW